jgi:hypothetical protein
VKDIKVEFGKKFDNRHLDDMIWKKSAFWDLPYWLCLEVRHCLDEMHIIKNITESLVGLLLHIPGKTKDSIKARKDMTEMVIRPELAVVEDGEKNRAYLPTTGWTLTKKEKLSLCKGSIKVRLPTYSRFD